MNDRGRYILATEEMANPEGPLGIDYIRAQLEEKLAKPEETAELVEVGSFSLCEESMAKILAEDKAKIWKNRRALIWDALVVDNLGFILCSMFAGGWLATIWKCWHWSVEKHNLSGGSAILAFTAATLVSIAGVPLMGCVLAPSYKKIRKEWNEGVSKPLHDREEGEA